MECLTGLIGLSASCSDTVYPLGYIDDLEGVGLKSLSSMEAGKYLSVQNLIDNKLRIVGSKMKEKFGGLLGDTMIEQAVQSIIPIQFSEDSLTGAYGNPGLRIEKQRTYLTKLYIPRVYFKSAVDVDGLVVTISDGATTETFTVSAAADEEVAIETAFQTDNLSVDITYPGADPSITVEPYTGSISPYHRYGCSTCTWMGNHYLKMSGIDFDGEETSRYYGLRADVQLICDVEKMICLMARKNSWIVKYMLGVEIAAENLTTDRLNFFSINSKDMWRELGAKWQYESDKLWSENGPSILSMLTRAERDCFICTGRHVTYTAG